MKIIFYGSRPGDKLESYLQSCMVISHLNKLCVALKLINLSTVTWLYSLFISIIIESTSRCFYYSYTMEIVRVKKNHICLYPTLMHYRI